jgi:uncharacterized membrane protein
MQTYLVLFALLIVLWIAFVEFQRARPYRLFRNAARTQPNESNFLARKLSRKIVNKTAWFVFFYEDDVHDVIDNVRLKLPFEQFAARLKTTLDGDLPRTAKLWDCTGDDIEGHLTLLAEDETSGRWLVWVVILCEDRGAQTTITTFRATPHRLSWTGLRRFVFEFAWAVLVTAFCFCLGDVAVFGVVLFFPLVVYRLCRIYYRSYDIAPELDRQSIQLHRIVRALLAKSQDSEIANA